MGFFRGRAERRTATLSQLTAIAERAGGSTAGVFVDADSANRHHAWWAAKELVAGVGSSLPLDEFRKVGDTQVPVALSSLFADPDPDPSITAQGWRAQLLRSVIARGNAYAYLTGWEQTGYAQQATTIHPDRVTWRRGESGRLETLLDGKPIDRWPLGPLWHFGLYQEAGSPVGMSPIEYHRNTIGGALAAQQYGHKTFKNGAPAWAVKVPQGPTKDELDALTRDIFNSATSGGVVTVPSELSFEKLTISPADSQFIDSQRLGVEDIARIILGGFVELIGGSVSGGSLTYANREQRMADFTALSLAPRYLVPFEAALSQLVPRDRYVKHNLDALMRADLKARYESYKLAAEVSDLMGEPMLTVDEMRDFENLTRLSDVQRSSFAPLRRPVAPTQGGPIA